MVGSERSQMTIHTIIGRRHFADLITNTTDTNSEYLTFIAFQRQQLLSERASMLHYTQVASLVQNLIRSTTQNMHKYF